MDGVVNVIDGHSDVGADNEQRDKRLRQLLDRIRNINLQLNKDKHKIGITEIKYIGHILSSEVLKPDQEKVKAVMDMPRPHDKAALMRFFGMVRYLS